MKLKIIQNLHSVHDCIYFINFTLRNQKLCFFFYKFQQIETKKVSFNFRNPDC